MMRFVLLACCALLVSSASPREQFEEYKIQFGKVYESETEEEMRFDVFKGALERIAEGNKRNGQPVFGLTPMSDRKPEESFKRGRKGYGDTRFIHSAKIYTPAQANANLPAAIDWRLTTAVTPVKNQGQCGSCWAFSTAEEVESQYALQVSDGYAATFSPQQIASCVEACDGCAGGDTVTAYEYLKGSPGLASSFFWPYAQGLTPLHSCSAKACTESCSSHNLNELGVYETYIGPAAKVTGFEYATPACAGACENQDLTKLASSLVNAGPVSVCVNAGSWNDYTGGVLTAEGCGSMAADELDHCVQLVGYNTSVADGSPYWIVRNSWAASWGEEGYIYLQFDANTCGLADEATIVKLASSRADDAPFQRLQRQAIPSDAVVKPAGRTFTA
mmetsp:Transcript_45523/g.105512  ORF Transcript_45523/g.105512 Transcript_45523/m.105512 type:complete len:390 (-) Transcript_45523:107-1276(-)|eukprot:683859-Amphidinium_carterae.1